MSGHHLYAPIFVTSREFKSKVLIAASAAERGFDTYLGSDVAIHSRLPQLPPGIYFGKDAQPNKTRWFDEVRSMGHGIVVTDEEFIFVRDFDVGHDWFIRVRTGEQTLGMIDAFLCPGPAQRDAIRRHVPHHARRIQDTGNARLDLLRPEFVAAATAAGERRRAELGPYILVNTNFGEANYVKGDPELLMQIYKDAWKLSDEELGFFRDKMRFEARIFEHFKVMVPHLARSFPDVTICVRPHPAEDQRFWKALADEHPNVAMRFEGTAIEWSAGAIATVHNSCTTGLEAALAGFPVVAYRPEISERFEFSLPNNVSLQTYSLDELVSVLHTPVRARDGASIALSRDEVRDAVAEMVSAYDGVAACDRTAEVLLDIAGERGAVDDGRERRWRLMRRLLRAIFLLRSRLRPAAPEQLADTNNRARPFQAREVRELLGLFAASSGRFASVTCEDIGFNLVRVHARPGASVPALKGTG